MQDSASVTIKNLESAFAGESMAHIKYMYFAKLCRAAGDEATAKVFEDTADQEVQHAFGHAEMLFGGETMTPAKCLQYAIEGETYEYTEMYPKSKPGLFAREATGLVREMGFTLGVIIILTHVIRLGWQKRAFQFTGPRPMPTDMKPLGLPAMFWVFLVCGLIVLVTGYAAGYVAAAMPRSGGGYVTITRVLHPSIGYMSGWLMFLAEEFSYGLIGVAVFEGVSIFFGIANAPTPLPAWIGDPMWLFIGGLAIVWIFAILALLGTKLYGRYNLLQVRVCYLLRFRQSKQQ